MPHKTGRTCRFGRCLAIQPDKALRPWIYFLFDFIRHHPDWLVQIRIQRKHWGPIEQVAPGIVNQACRQVDLGPFFFRVSDCGMGRGRQG
jgi:hypothetical protein